jgi:Tfp pilus assembly protein FimV
MSTATTPLDDQSVRPVRPVRRVRRHPTYRRRGADATGFRPGGVALGSDPASGPHRTRPSHARCDPRTAARAAAVRRRHVLLGVVAIVLLLALAVPWGTKANSALSHPGPLSPGATLAPHSLYIVRPGDTLWSIAERLDPRGDPRPVMAELSAQAGSDTVRPGEHLILP